MPTNDRELSTARPELKRAISGFGFFALAFGSMIGVGWITALGGWFEQAGPIGAIVAFTAGGTLMLIIGLCYAEVTPMLPVTGGEVAYAYKAYGTSKAFVIGWFLAFGYLSVSAFEAISVGLVLSFLFPQIDVLPLYEIAGSTVYASHLLLAFVFTGFITAINYFGVGIASRVQIVLTGVFLMCALLFVVSGIASGEIGNLAPYFGDSALGFLSACLGRGAIIAFVDVGSFCIALAFLGVALSLIQLRKKFPLLERPYRMPGGNVLAYVAAAGSLFILCVMLVPGSPSMLVWPLEWLILGALSATGWGFWFAGRRYRQRVSEEDRAQLILEDYAS